MKKTMILIMAVATTIKATAQSVTYNHDSSKQNQRSEEHTSELQSH